MSEIADFLRAMLEQAKARQENSFDQWHNRDCASIPEEGQYTFTCDCGVPQRVLADIDAKLALIDDLLAERHHVNDGDCWYTCPAATEERDGGEICDDNRRGGRCDCGRDARVNRRLAILAQPFAGQPGHKGDEWAI